MLCNGTAVLVIFEQSARYADGIFDIRAKTRTPLFGLCGHVPVAKRPRIALFSLAVVFLCVIVPSAAESEAQLCQIIGRCQAVRAYENKDSAGVFLARQTGNRSGVITQVYYFKIIVTCQKRDD